MALQELCQIIDSPEELTTALIDACSAACEIMYNHYLLCEWHHRESTAPAQLGIHLPPTGIPDKLAHARRMLWVEVQRYLAMLLNAHVLLTFKFDAYINLLAIINKMVAIGEDYAGRDSNSMLREAVKRKSGEFFRQFHRSQVRRVRGSGAPVCAGLCAGKPFADGGPSRDAGKRSLAAMPVVDFL